MKKIIIEGTAGINEASQRKEGLKGRHYAIENATERKIVPKQYDYQLYPNRLEELLGITGGQNLKIIPIGDYDVAGDFWVIPFERLKKLLIPENLTHGKDKNGNLRRQRWRFHIELQGHEFVLYPGNRIRLNGGSMSEFYGAQLPFL